jgi:hypothetical protein
VTLTQVGGGVFDFGGFDLVANLANDFPFTVTSNLGNTLSVNSLGGAVANWTGVSSVFFGASNSIGLPVAVANIDNVSVNPTAAPSVSAVPTPALLPGLIGMGVVAWRKRKVNY